MPNYTLTYSESSKGWPSFYSYYPDFMMGMNQFFYSFKGGNLWRHNTNETRNNFYGEQYTSTITSVFNETPLENKLFKTIVLEADDAWSATITTDIQTTGNISDSWFEKKEGSWFAFVRTTSPIPATQEEFELRSLNGLGRTTSVGGTSSAPELNFAVSVGIGSIVSVGDYAYFTLPTDTPAYSSPQLAGEITAVSVDLVNGVNQIVLDASIPGAVTPIPIQDAYFLYIKNSTAESHGVLGHYCEFILENDSTSATELFAVKTDLMKSFP